MSEEKKKLEDLLEETVQLSSVNNESGVRSGNISETTATQAIRRIQLKEKIQEIERCEEAHKTALSKLSEDDVELLDGFFNPKMPIWQFRIKYAETHFMGDTLIYKHRKQALKRYAKEIEKIIKAGD
jgi:hypothetical protein